MAWVKSVEMQSGYGRIQSAELSAKVKIFSVEGGEKIVQLDIVGAGGQEITASPGQSLQFGRDAAEQLYRILKDAYRLGK